MESKQAEHFNYIVVGGGISGTTCVERICQLKPDSSVAHVCQRGFVQRVRNVRSYGRAIVDFDIKSEEGSGALGHSIFINKAVAELNTENKLVVLLDGSTLSYDKIILCTGGSPKNEYPNCPLVYVVRDTSSALILQKKLESSKHIVIVGNGGIANELAFCLQNCIITWIVKHDHLTASFVDEVGGDFFEKELKENPLKQQDNIKKWVQFHDEQKGAGDQADSKQGQALGPDWHSYFKLKGASPNDKQLIIEKSTQIESINCVENEAKVTLSNGKVLECDAVIWATGVKPVTSGLEIKSQIKLGPEGGFLVDQNMETSNRDVFAAGDCCETRWPGTSPLWFQMRLWTQAFQLGYHAATCATDSREEMLDQPFCFDLFTHVTNFFGFKVILLGLFNAQGLKREETTLLVRRTPGVEYIKIVVVSGRIKGAILLGDTDLEETIENLIHNQTDISQFQDHFLDPTFDIEDFFD